MIVTWLGNFAFGEQEIFWGWGEGGNCIFNSATLQSIISFIMYSKEEKQSEHHVTNFHGEICSHKPSW